MFTDVFALTPICCRLFLKAVLAAQKNSEVLTLSRIQNGRSNDEFVRKGNLVVSAIDPAGSTFISFNFPSEFFVGGEVSELTTAGLSTPAVVNSKQVSRMFRGVSPNKIVSVNLKINVECIVLEFHWKSGLVSTRTVPTVTPTEGSYLPPSALPDPNDRFPCTLASFAPKFLQAILVLFPDSSALWKLTMSHRHSADEPGQSHLYLTNSVGGVESVSVVEMALTQADLNRNGSYFSYSERT